MLTPGPLPPALDRVFLVSQARELGVSAERLRRADLARPFYGLRKLWAVEEGEEGPCDDFERQARARRARALEYGPKLLPGQFFSHETAAALWRAPLPLVTDEDRRPVPGGELPVHVSAFGDGPLPRARGVAGHRARLATSSVRMIEAAPVSSPATTWAALGATLSLYDLVAVGDFFCRAWRGGVGRPNIGMPPVATRAELAAAVTAGRRVGIRRLRAALELVREDSWSPRESRLRCILHDHGLPEPELNVDVHDDDGRFIGCVDLAYPDRKVAIEYHGILHSETYARDVERIARLRAAGWIVVEVTSALLADEAELIRRVRAALRG